MKCYLRELIKMVDTTSTTLTQGAIHNIYVLNEKVMETESKNLKLKH